MAVPINEVPDTGLAETLKAQGNAQKAAGALEDALASYRRSLEVAPDYLPAMYNIGLVLRQLNRPEEAEQQFRRIRSLHPRDADVIFHLAALLAVQSRLAESVEMYREVLLLTPENPYVWVGLAHTHTLAGARDQAVKCYETALRFAPDNATFRGGLLHAMQLICDWSRFEELCELQRRSVREETVFEISPFPFLCIPSTAQEQLQCARAYARQFKAAPGRRAFPHPREKRSRLKVGYFSADFREHSMAHVLAELFELHDRASVEPVAYSCGPDDGSPMRARMLRAFDDFVDISAMSDSEAAARIHADRVDILVDLLGYTQHARLDIFAMRPAPIQASYLGYPGTMGAEFIDYLIVDDYIAPAGRTRDYSEQLVYMPGSYQVNDRRRPLSGTPPRKAVGLPENAFVFCCFNQANKILPAMFASWMRLLKAVPGSVLWLVENSPWTSQNLRREADGHGIAPERLIFAPTLPYEAYLARIGAADLFLDTFPYNAHATGSDALWAGLPLLTLSGETFASRVAGSMLNAVGMPKLITRSLEDYEARALHLARNPRELAALRARLSANRTIAPLFDTPAFTRHLESAYRQMWELHRAGEAARAIRP